MTISGPPEASGSPDCTGGHSQLWARSSLSRWSDGSRRCADCSSRSRVRSAAMQVGGRVEIDVSGRWRRRRRLRGDRVFGRSRPRHAFRFTLQGVRRGCEARVAPGGGRRTSEQAPGSAGRDRRARPADRRSSVPLEQVGETLYPFRADPPARAFAPARRRPRSTSASGPSIRSSRPACRGQRMGIFAGSGVGKSVTALHDGSKVRQGLRRLGDRPHRRTRPRGAGIPAGRSRSRPKALKRSVVVVSTSDEPALDAPQRGLPHLVGRRVLPRPGPVGALHDGFGDPLRDGPTRYRARRRRAADRQGLHADGVQRAAAPAGEGRAGAGRGHDHGALHGAGGRRRPQRTRGGRRAGHPGRPYRDGA